MTNPRRRATNATKASSAAMRSPYAAGTAKAAGNSGATTPFTRNASPINRKLCKRERTQGIPARLGAKYRPEVLSCDDTPGDETKGDANSEQRLRRHVLLLSVSCANPLNPSLAIGGTADIDGYGGLGRLGLDANDVCLSAFSFSLVG